MIININTEKKYNIEIRKGLLSEIGMRLMPLKDNSKICIISDSAVFNLWGSQLENSLLEAGFNVYKLVFPPGEKTKSFHCLEEIVRFLAINQFTKSDFLVAFGGGVIGDLTGFAASVYLRGIDYIQIPTTLLSAVDSSIGGKTAINISEGKNLAGSFWQPKNVYFDIQTLETLPWKELQNGLSEIIKTGVILDSSIISMLEDTPVEDLGYIMEDLIVKSIYVKKRIVEMDENEHGLRKTLNLGHTIGHAAEILSDFKLSHGIAVAAGTAAMARCAEKLNWSANNISPRLDKLYNKLHFNLHLPFTPEDLAKIATSDKKRKGQLITLVIPQDIGRCILRDVHISQLPQIFEAGLKCSETEKL